MQFIFFDSIDILIYFYTFAFNNLKQKTMNTLEKTTTQKTIDPYLPLVTIAQVAMFRQARVMNGFHFPDNQSVDFWVKDGILTFQYIDRIDQLTQGEGEPIEEDRHSFMTINLLENARIEQLYDKLQEVFEVIEEHEVKIKTIK